MYDTINRAEAWQVCDVAALEALPIGTRLNSTNGPATWWEIDADGLRYCWQDDSGEHRSRKAYRKSALFFSGMGPRRGSKTYRYLLNPEVLGEFRPAS